MAEQCAPTVTYPDTFIQHIPAHSYSATSPRTTALLFLWVVLSPPPPQQGWGCGNEERQKLKRAVMLADM